MLPVVVVALSLTMAQPPERTERRQQASLGVSGEVVKGKGFVVSAVTPGGPCTKMTHPTRDDVTGLMDPGDLITRVDGQPFADLRELLDLLNAGHRRNGVVRLTVRDVNTPESMVWTVTPRLVMADVPLKRFDLAAEIGEPVPEAPAPPVVPGTITP